MNPPQGLYIDEAINGGVFTSNDDNAWIPMATGPDASDVSINRESSIHITLSHMRV